jgi:hypothetical protein
MSIPTELEISDIAFNEDSEEVGGFYPVLENPLFQ